MRLKALHGSSMSILALVSACAAPPAAERESVAPASLAGTRWTLRSLAGADVTPPPPTLSFDEPGRAGGLAGVNRFGGDAEIAGDSLQLGPFMSTLMAGPPERMELERRYLEALGEVGRWAIVEGRLELAGPDGTLATFEPSPVAAR